MYQVDIKFFYHIINPNSNIKLLYQSQLRILIQCHTSCILKPSEGNQEGENCTRMTKIFDKLIQNGIISMFVCFESLFKSIKSAPCVNSTTHIKVRMFQRSASMQVVNMGLKHVTLSCYCFPVIKLC